MQRTLRGVLTVSLIGVAVFLVTAMAVRSFGDIRAQILLTFIGLAVGAWLAEIHQGALDRTRAISLVALGAILASQVCYYLLVWTDWVVMSATWRIWYLSVVVTVTLTHMVVLRIAAGERLDGWDKATLGLVPASGALFLFLGLRSNLLEDPNPAFWWLAGVPWGLTAILSFVAWRRWKKAKVQPSPMTPRSRWSWMVGTTAGLFALGFYLGRITAPPPSLLDLFPSALATLTPEEVDAMVKADLGRLKVVLDGVDELREKSERVRSEIGAAKSAAGRDYFLPEEDARLRGLFLTYLNYRTALLRMMATYAGFEAVRDPEAKARCFLVGYGAGAGCFEASLHVVAMGRDDKALRNMLNESDPEWGLPAGMYDRIFEAVTNDRDVELFEEMTAYYEKERGRWRKGAIWPAEDFDWLSKRIARSMNAVRAGRPSAASAMLARVLKRVKKDAYTPVYTIQTAVSTWVGDTRVAQRPPYITIEQIKSMQSNLKPGDILLERRNWFLSNAFLPGFWPHAALYLGTAEDLKRLGIADAPAVKSRWTEYTRLAPDGEPHTVMESVSEGVIFNSLTESMHADYVAVLRPRLSQEAIAKAISTAFRHQGKPYDFEFDFSTADKLVCTELVYRSYEGLLHFQLVHIMGRDTLPALEIVRKFARERSNGNAELDFVMFLDGDLNSGAAREADAETFCGSANRPRAFNE